MARTQIPEKEECLDNHQWIEVYYGHECSTCGLFYAFGSAPWEDGDVVDVERLTKD